MIEAYLKNTIDDISIPGLSNPYSGKVRQSYDAPGERKIIIATDRLSAFDRQITTVPFKGQVLTQLARFWFDQTTDICPNHVIAYPDPNVLVCKKLKMLPVEMVVRGYLAGSTATSILKMYKAGRREMYGVTFKNGMRDNQRLDQPVITPTTKGDAGTHDEELSGAKIVADGILSKEIWEKVSSYTLALFQRGQKIAQEKGLILADTKYEFGMLPDGTVVLGDEIHTPDSSRYWIADSYQKRFEEGQAPETLDKDVIRRWVSERCDPYKEEIPPIPDDLRLATAETYLSVYEKITGQKLELPSPSIDPIERIKKAVFAYLTGKE
ncbi:MAG: phosphoribosylaminoimidazolesuccinocarboxamide synthase [Alphaproteobacteria bacterium]|nr:phosphoribosylaminoimidazolesuccinocarboxamide synthase [Alphaproteobacteria bacterium]